MDRLGALSAFVTVCEAGGFGVAARRLGVSPSVVTRQVAGLEDRLGARLIHRTTRALALTDAGERYLDRARRILADLEEADLAAQGEAAEPRGRLSVTAPLIFGRLHVAPLLARFLAAHPQVTGALELSDRFVNLVDEGHDVAIRIGHLADSQLIARRVGETRRVVVASPAYLARAGMPEHPRALQRFDTIALTAVDPGLDWRFLEARRELRVRVTPRYLTNSSDAAIGCAIDGVGLTLVLYYQVREAIAAGRLVEVLGRFAPPPLPIHAVHPTARLVPGRVRAFLDLIDRTTDWRLG